MNLVRACGCIAALVILLSFMNIPAVTAGPDLQTITFDRSELTIERLDGFDRVSYGSFEPSRQVGFPQLPVKLIRFLVPPGRVVASITVTGVKSEPIDGQYIVFPTQAPQILSKNEYRFVPPQKHIYDSMVPFPAEPATARPGGYFVGQNIGALAVYPVQYIPALKQLVFYSEINIRISYRDEKRLPLPYRGTPYTESIRRTALQTLLKDSEPVIQKPQRFSAAGTALPAEDHAYVIITSESLADAFKPLADWKHRKGLGATTVTTAWIYQNYTGPDNPAKIRNFIKDAYQNWGTVWVLLGGDSWIVPTRYAFAFDCEYGAPSDNNIPCDLYYSDLDGSWNANGNSVYGEVDDNVDMYPDVFVGRVSVEDTLEAAAYVGKLLSYEHSLYGTERDMLFLAAVLWDTPYTNSGLAKNHIDELYVPARFDPITKLYQANGNEDYTSAMNALNAGHHIINHCGHAYIQTLNAGLGYLMDYDMDVLTNGPHYSILFSIGCWPASFDEDCIAEHFIQNPNGGGVAFVGNSRYGWGSPGNPLYGYSDRFDQQFFKQLFVEDNYHIGRTLAAAKAAYVPFAGQENVYRWCEYELNLLGDPEMMIWTDDAAVLAADHPAELFAGESHCPVTVTAGGEPVEGALVCVMQSGTFYESGFTGPDGRVMFGFSSSNPMDPVLITATAHNCIPYTDSIPLTGSGPYVQISRYTMDGSEEGFVSPDDLVQVEAYFTNFGTDTAFQVSAELVCSNPLVTIVDSHESIPYIAPGEFKWVLGGFSYTTAPGLIDGDVIQFNSVISDSAGHVWTDKLCATGATPVLFFSEYDINDDAYGDGDGLAESGETVQLNMLVRNTGRRPAHLIRALLSSRHSDVQVINSSVVYWSIPPSGCGQVPASVRIDPDCPQPLFPLIDVVFETSDGYIFSDSFTLAVGDVGFFDDMEGGDGGWTHSGAYDHWHRSSYRQNSGNTSWYSGHEGLRTYISGTSTSLKSPPIVIDRDSELSFWCWYEFPNYGTDGFYVNLYNGQEWITLDYIGSGGALGILPTGNTWLEYTYDLSEYAAGTTIAVRFHQVIDLEGVLEEGVYIDDVSVRRRSSGDLVTFVPPAGGLSPVTRLHQNYPNPFNPVTTIGYSLEQSGQVSIVIFNIQGAQVLTLLSGTAAAGPNSVVWDGKNDSGTAVSSGVYFYRLVAGDFVQTKKMVLLR